MIVSFEEKKKKKKRRRKRTRIFQHEVVSKLLLADPSFDLAYPPDLVFCRLTPLVSAC